MNIEERYKARIDSMREFTYQWNPETYEDSNKPILKITKSLIGVRLSICITTYNDYLKTKQKQCVKEQYCTIIVKISSRTSILRRRRT